MRQQLPASKRFRFEQAEIQVPWVTVVPLDTVMGLNNRLGWQAEYMGRDALFQRFGADRTFAILGILFSRNHKKALVNTADEGSQTCLYTKTRTGWRREATLYSVVY